MTPDDRLRDSINGTVRDHVYVRYAEPGDIGRLASRFSYDAVLDRETVALFRGRQGPARLWLRDRAATRHCERTLVAVYSGSIVGVLDFDLPGDEHQSRLATLRSLLRASRGRIAPLTLFGRVAVNTPFPDDACVVSSIRVVPRWRGYGIGTKLLRYVEVEAWALSIAGLALSALTDNPAVRLYKREGFVVLDMKLHPWYLNGTGRALMVKAL